MASDLSQTSHTAYRPTAGPLPLYEADWLQGVLVVEVTIGVSSPLTSRVLADLGARVIKVESRAKLDVNRARLQRRDNPGVPVEESFSLLHEANAGKESITLNLKEPDGQALLLRLLEDADVFVQNFAPGWLERLGLSIDGLLDANPGLVVLSAAGYGQKGPLRAQRAYAPVMTALAGVEGLVGYEDGEVVGTMASALADMNASYVGAFLVLSALHDRQSTGLGQHIDLSQTEASATLVGEAMVDWQVTGEVPGAQGNTNAGETPWHLFQFEGQDNWVAVTGVDSSQVDGLTARASETTAAEFVDACRGHGLECHRVAASGAHGTAEGEPLRLAQRVIHPMIGEMEITTLPWQLDGSLVAISAAAPLLGQHTAAVARQDLGLSDEQIEDYTSRGVFR